MGAAARPLAASAPSASPSSLRSLPSTAPSRLHPLVRTYREYIHGLPIRARPLAYPPLCAVNGTTTWLPRCFDCSTVFRHRRSSCPRHTPHESHPYSPARFGKTPEERKNFPHPRLPPHPPHFCLQGPILIKPVQGETPCDPPTRALLRTSPPSPEHFF